MGGGCYVRTLHVTARRHKLYWRSRGVLYYSDILLAVAIV